MKSRVLLVFIILLSSVYNVSAERIKDIINIQGVRSNPLEGIGLVVGLAGTGDQSLSSQQMLANILRASGVVLSPTDLKGGNIAIVMVTTQLGPFAREGSKIDINVSSIGDAESLQGGTLLATPLKGLDGQVYAVTLGTGISIGGWNASGNQASVSKNHQTVGHIPDGAIVEVEEIADFVSYIGNRRVVNLNLRHVDFTTANRISNAINNLYANASAVIDGGTIEVEIPANVGQNAVAGFIDEITQLNVKVDNPAVVVINERTGTIVVGENVAISTVAICQGSLVIKVRETASVYQPTTPFTRNATTEKVDETIIDVKESKGHLIPVRQTVTVSELAKALNAIGASPTDLIAIFNALKTAGALQAELKIM